MLARQTLAMCFEYMPMMSVQQDCGVLNVLAVCLVETAACKLQTCFTLALIIAGSAWKAT